MAYGYYKNTEQIFIEEVKKAVSLYGCAINTTFTAMPRCHKSAEVANGLKKGRLCGKKGKIGTKTCIH